MAGRTVTSPAVSLGSAVVDTDVVSYWHRGDSRGPRYAEALAGLTLIISFQTLAEQLRWAEQQNWGARRLDQFLNEFVVYPYSYALAQNWASIMSESARIGRTLSTADGWIAATARLLDVPLATNNRKHFEVVEGLPIVSFA